MSTLGQELAGLVLTAATVPVLSQRYYTYFLQSLVVLVPLLSLHHRLLHSSLVLNMSKDGPITHLLLTRPAHSTHLPPCY